VIAREVDGRYHALGREDDLVHGGWLGGARRFRTGGLGAGVDLAGGDVSAVPAEGDDVQLTPATAQHAHGRRPPRRIPDANRAVLASRRDVAPVTCDRGAHTTPRRPRNKVSANGQGQIDGSQA
jgi:hypothetical protein